MDMAYGIDKAPVPRPPGWWRRLLVARREARAVREAREKAREGAVVPVVAGHVPLYPAVPVVRPKRHRRGLRGRSKW